MYILNPPVFKEDYGNSFGESWEIFCLKLLKLHYKTTEIEKRNPPESGVDLYLLEKIAFQCKSTVDENGKFNFSNAKKSLEDALKIQRTLGWEKFILCINGEITGDQINKLKKIYSNLEIYSKHFWIHICENNPQIVQNHFKKIIDVPSSYQTNKLKNISKIPQEIKDIIQKRDDYFSIWLYVDQQDKLISINVYSEMTVENLLYLIKSILGITESTFIQNQEVQVSCTLYYKENFINNTTATLSEFNIKEFDVVSLNLKIDLPDITISSLMLNDTKNLTTEYLKERENFLLKSIKSYIERGY